MNIDTVKPMPQTTQMLANEVHDAPDGNDTTLSRIAIQENEKTPRNFPTTKPNITARLAPENRPPMLIPESAMPALAKAKRGTTT